MRKTENSELGRPTAEEFAAMSKMPVTVVLDGIRSLNNVGSFFRTCDALAAQRIILCGITGTPPDKEIHKTALGAENTVTWEYAADCAQALQKLRAEGYCNIAIEQVDGSTPLGEFHVSPQAKYALVFGNEVWGVSDAALEVCDQAVEIPQRGTKHSLNVSVSGGIVLWHFFCEYQKAE